MLFVCLDEHISGLEIIEQTEGNLRELIIYYPKRGNVLSRKRMLEKAFQAGLDRIEKPDLIHGHCLLPKGHLFSKAKSYFKCPLIVTEHGSYFRLERIRKWSFKERLIMARTKGSIDQLIAVSEFQKKDLNLYFKGWNIDVLPNPIDTELFKPAGIPSDEKKRFLHISTLDRELKNPQCLIEAVDLLCAKGYTQFELTIISDEPFQDFQKEVERLKLDRYISFVGPLEHQELVAHYNNSHALVMCSRYETFSIVIAEAWSCGIPVISTPVGIAAQMDSQLGLLVSNFDPLSLALEMEKLIDGKEFHRQTIREYALQFSNKVVLEQLINLYNGLR